MGGDVPNLSLLPSGFPKNREMIEELTQKIGQTPVHFLFLQDSLPRRKNQKSLKEHRVPTNDA
jgi:hypothetical protein